MRLHCSPKLRKRAIFWWAWRKRSRRRTEITIEIDEITVLGSGRSSAEAWCSGCEAPALMVTPQHASAIAQVSVRTINQWVETDVVHFVETPDRLLLVCLNSLNNCTTGKLVTNKERFVSP